MRLSAKQGVPQVLLGSAIGQAGPVMGDLDHLSAIQATPGPKYFVASPEISRQANLNPKLRRWGIYGKQAVPCQISGLQEDVIAAFLERHGLMLSPDAKRLANALPRDSLTIQSEIRQLRQNLICYMADSQRYHHHLKPLMKGLSRLGLCLTTLNPQLESESIMTLKEMDKRPGVVTAGTTVAKTTALDGGEQNPDVHLWSIEEWVAAFRYADAQPTRQAALCHSLFYDSKGNLCDPERLKQTWTVLGLILDTDELGQLFGHFKQPRDLVEFLEAVYHEVYSQQEPYLVIVLFAALAHCGDLSDVLVCLLKENRYREMGVHLLVESQIYLNFADAQQIARCYEAVAKTEPSWFAVFGDVLRHYAVVPADSPITWMGTDLASPRERYLLAMAKLGHAETKTGGLEDLASLAARQDTSLELREKVAEILLVEVQGSGTDKPMRKACEQGLLALQGRVMNEALWEAIPYVLGPGRGRALAVWTMGQVGDRAGLKKIIESDEPAQIEALIAYTRIDPNWQGLDLSHIRDWSRLVAPLKSVHMILIDQKQILWIPETVGKHTAVFFLLDFQFTPDQWRLARSRLQFKIDRWFTDLPPENFCFKGDFSVADIEDVFGALPTNRLQMILAFFEHTPTTQNNLKQWLLSFVQNPSHPLFYANGRHFGLAMSALLDKYGVVMDDLPEDVQLRWAMNCFGDVRSAPCSWEQALRIWKKHSEKPLPRDLWEAWGKIVTRTARGCLWPHHELEEMLTYFPGEGRNQMLLSLVKPSESHGAADSTGEKIPDELCYEALQILIKDGEHGRLNSDDMDALGDGLRGILCQEPALGLRVWRTLSAGGDVAHTLNRHVGQIVHESTNKEVLDLCLRYMEQHPFWWRGDSNPYETEITFVKKRIALMDF